MSDRNPMSHQCRAVKANADTVDGHTLLDMRVVIDIAGIVVIDELKLRHLPVYNENQNDQSDPNSARK